MNSHQFDYDAWRRLDVFNQMGNIGSEVGRALKAKRAGNTSSMEAALFRGVDLINATVKDWLKSGKGNVHELLLARELFGQSVLTEQEDPKLEDYFMQFALVARMRRSA